MLTAIILLIGANLITCSYLWHQTRQNPPRHCAELLRARRKLSSHTKVG